jgi:hypothetical protein
MTGYEKSPDYGGRPPIDPVRKWAAILYAALLVILVHYFWPGWPFPNKADAPAAPQAAQTTPVPQN